MEVEDYAGAEQAVRRALLLEAIADKEAYDKAYQKWFGDAAK